MSSLRQVVEAEACWDYGEEIFSNGRRNAGTEADQAREEARLLHERLARTIESEIIPRLLLAHTASPDLAASGEDDCVPDAEEVADFARIILVHDLPVAFSYVEAVRAQGMSLETLFLGLLAPTARLLGEWWTADICTFVDVTLGLSRLQLLVRELSPVFAREGAPRGGSRRVLLVAAPGEQHTFGLSIVQEFFSRAGWDVCEARPASSGELLGLLCGEWVSVVGLSVSGDTMLGQLPAIIRSIRQESLNPAIGVMVGGPVFVDNPELVARVGADATAADAREAVLKAQGLLGSVARRC